MDKRLRNMEIMVQELHMDTRQLSRRNSDTASDNTLSGASSTASSQDRDRDILRAVSQQLELTRQEAENAEEWTDLLDQLEKFKLRLLNHIERRTSSNAQRGCQISSIQLNQELASWSPTTTSFIKPSLSRAETFDSGFGEGLPSVLEEGDDFGDELEPLAESPFPPTIPMTPASLFNSSTRRLDEFRNPETFPNERRRLSLVTGDHRAYSVSSSIESTSPQTFSPSVLPATPLSSAPSGFGSPSCSPLPPAFGSPPFSTSPPTFKSPFSTSPPALTSPLSSPSFELPPSSASRRSSGSPPCSPEPYHRRQTFSVDSSDTSASALHSCWQQVPLCGWVKMFVVLSIPMFNFANFLTFAFILLCRLRSWADQPTNVSCSLEARYGAGGDAFAIRAVQETTDAAISTLKCTLSSSLGSSIVKLIRPVLLFENRPVPHTEPVGPRDNPEDGIRVYFINPPPTEPSMDGVCFFFENQDGQSDLCLFVP